MSRVLAPGGHLTVLWNNRLNDESPLLAGAWGTIRRFVPGFEDHYRDNTPWDQILASTGHFTFVKIIEARHVVTMSTQRFVDLWRSHNRLNHMAGADRMTTILDAIERQLEDERAGQVPVPYLCRSWTARRID